MRSLLATLALALAATLAHAGCGDGYSYYKTFTIDHTKVPNTNQSNFPVYFAGDSALKTAANSGRVQSSSALDVIFCPDNTGTGAQLAHELVAGSYNASSGAGEWWINVPTVNGGSSSSTVIYMFYGKSGVSDTSAANTVWSNGYVLVLHFGTSNAISTVDSSGVNGSITNTNVAAATGIAGGAGSFSNTATRYFRVPSNSSIKPTTAITLEAWVNPSSIGAGYWSKVFGLDYRADGTWTVPYLAYSLQWNGSSYYQDAQLTPNSTTNSSWAGTNSTSTGAWHQWAVSWSVADSYTVRFYQDGSANGTGTFNYSRIDYGTSLDLTIGARSPYTIANGEAWNGLIDEARISNVVRSVNWLTAQYNNLYAPSSFYSLGTETLTAATPVWSPGTGTYSGSQTGSVTCSTTGAYICYSRDGSTTPVTDGAGGCTAGSLYSSSFSITSTETDKAVCDATGYVQSAEADQTVTILSTAPTPTASPVAGTYGGTVAVTLACSLGSSAICYTTDGSTPTESGNSCSGGTTATYSSPISVTSTETIKALCTKSGYTDSSLLTAAYTIQAGMVQVWVLQ